MSSPKAARFQHVPRLAPPPVADEIGEETLWAGDILVSDKRIRMTTVLGSCVSVCLFDSLRCFGGMNHYLLPSPGEGSRHGEWSIRELYERMLALGSRPRNLQAKVFGGGSPLALVNDVSAIGMANARVAFDTLGKLRVSVVGESVGENAGMRLYFENWSGVALVRPHRGRSEP
jgi:chemotaxis protein CheD